MASKYSVEQKGRRFIVTGPGDVEEEFKGERETADWLCELLNTAWDEGHLSDAEEEEEEEGDRDEEDICACGHTVEQHPLRHRDEMGPTPCTECPCDDLEDDATCKCGHPNSTHEDIVGACNVCADDAVFETEKCEAFEDAVEE